MKIFRFKCYQYKEIVKLFFNNYNDPLFKKTKKFLNLLFILPGMTVAGFNLISPFSIFKGIGIYGVVFGTMGSLAYQF